MLIFYKSFTESKSKIKRLVKNQIQNITKFYIYIYMRDMNNNLLPLHSVSWVEPNLQMPLRYNIYLSLSQ